MTDHGVKNWANGAEFVRRERVTRKIIQTTVVNRQGAVREWSFRNGGADPVGRGDQFLFWPFAKKLSSEQARELHRPGFMEIDPGNTARIARRSLQARLRERRKKAASPTATATRSPRPKSSEGYWRRRNKR